MSRALAYCAFCHRPEISLPSTGVTAADVRVMAEGELRLLWSEVEWPFAPERMQKNALEFHDVISHVFRQAAVVPFRLLSIFEDERSLATFTAEHAKVFLADLEKLKDCVQMECVIFPAPSRRQTNNSSGADYLREKAAMLREQEEHVKTIQGGMSGLAREIKVREGKNGTRIFILTERGREKEFRSIVEQQAVPPTLSRRVSGPWPAAEFLSEQVRAPQVAGAK
ncbi:MAG TPA: GvpL/GvpF family gas vesicle protein [Candidatus Angelobacter sp.]|nr:GvpL/GvpF family gas vesicle protein [Candidatus Angelobacter sp.]